MRVKCHPGPAALLDESAAVRSRVVCAENHRVVSAKIIGPFVTRSGLRCVPTGTMKHSSCAEWCSVSSAARSGSFAPLKITSGRSVAWVIAGLPGEFFVMTPLVVSPSAELLSARLVLSAQEFRRSLP